MKVMVKRVGKEAELVDSESSVRGEVCKQYLEDAFIEFVTLYNNPTESSALMMMVDEDGLCKELETNFLIEMQSPVYPIEKIVGDVVFMRLKKLSENEEDEVDDYEVVDLTEGDKIRIELLLNEKYQRKLRANFKDYDWSMPLISFETITPNDNE